MTTEWWEDPLREGEFDVPVMFRVTAADEAAARTKVQRIVATNQFEHCIVPMWVPPPAVRCHIWRYDATTPREERPWIISFHLADNIAADALDFETWAEAVHFVTSDAVKEHLCL